MPGVFDWPDPKFSVQAVPEDPPAGKAVDETAHKRGSTAE